MQLGFGSSVWETAMLEEGTQKGDKGLGKSVCKERLCHVKEFLLSSAGCHQYLEYCRRLALLVLILNDAAEKKSDVTHQNCTLSC